MTVIYFTHCINEAILCPVGNDTDHIAEEILKNFNGHVKTSLGVRTTCRLQR
jgi:hypothetical protein